jgi:hypothetical protein
LWHPSGFIRGLILIYFMETFLSYAHRAFTWLDGKKTYIAGSILLTNSLLWGLHTYSDIVKAYIDGMVAILMLGAEYSTVKLGARMGARK